MIESQYTKKIHDRLPSKIRAWKINDNFEGGVPDAFYRNTDTSAPTQLLWVEYKFLKSLPKRESTTIVPKLSKLQLKYLNEIYKSNSKEDALVIVGVEKVAGYRTAMGFPLYAPEWESGITCEQVAHRLLDYSGLSDLIVEKTVFY